MTTLGIFLKRPEAGRVKTRLGEEIGLENAARLAAAFQSDVLRLTEGIADRRVLAFAPTDPDSERHFQSLIAEGDELWPQPEGPLGTRLFEFFEQHCQNGSPSVVIGSDSPTLPRKTLRQAFEQLRSSDCVIGPAEDGGYYLLGLNQPQPSLFENIEWSTPAVLSQTLERARDRQLSVVSLETWYDIDTIGDLNRLRRDLAKQSEDERPHATAREVARLVENRTLGPANE